jgi:hypothetical protein
MVGLPSSPIDRLRWLDGERMLSIGMMLGSREIRIVMLIRGERAGML